MLETGIRAGEVVSPANARRGPDGRHRRSCAAARAVRGASCQVGPQTARAVDRYLRLRRTHRLAGTPDLWLGDRGKQFHLRRPAQVPGDARRPRRHRRLPHRMRHTAAHRWLAAVAPRAG
jgi:hypothetical protein